MKKRKIKRYAEGDYVESYETLGRRLKEREDADRGVEVGEVPSGSTETKELSEPDSVAGTGAKNLALDRGPATSYSREQTEAKDEARRIRAEIERKRAAERARTAKSKDEDERTAERRMKLKGEEYTARKIGAGYAKAASSVPAASPAEMERRKKMEKEQALETVAPEMNLIGGPGLKAVQKGAQALAAKEAAKNIVKKRVEPSFRPIKDITPGPEKIGMAPRRIGYEPPKLGMKKGGKVSSASSRADGIASRGKTRGRIC